MRGPKSFELLGILADIAVEGGQLAANKLASICFKAYGGSDRAYLSVLKRLEEKGLISIEKDDPNDKSTCVPQLTAAGKREIEPNCPFQAWNSKWDGQWRLLTFDLPKGDSKSRFRLREWLKAFHFGKLQGSVWLSHRSLKDIENSFAELEISPDQVVCIEGSFWGSGDNDTYVEKAWPLDRVQEAYAKYLDFLSSTQAAAKTLKGYQNWKLAEQALWSDATNMDPLLPQALWPKSRRDSNLALQAYQKRQEAIQNWQNAALTWH